MYRDYNGGVEELCNVLVERFDNIMNSNNDIMTNYYKLIRL